MNVNLKKQLCFVLFVFISAISFAQHTLKGAVIDEKGEPLIGATVKVINSTEWSTVDFDGNFTINIPNNNSQIEVMFLGYITQNIEIKNKKSITVTLLPDDMQLEEVVITALGNELPRGRAIEVSKQSELIRM